MQNEEQAAARPTELQAVSMVVAALSLVGLAYARHEDGQQRTERADRARQPPAAPLHVNVNEASAAQLQLLPRIGPKMAAKIIAHREQHGAFHTAEGLQEVSGIGPRTMVLLRPLISVKATLPSTAAAGPEAGKGWVADRDTRGATVLRAGAGQR